MTDVPVLEVVYDYICPWCYLGAAHAERLHTEFGVKLRWTLFPLHPEIPTDGMLLAELFRGRAYDVEAMNDRLQAAADQVGLPIVRRARISNSRRAQELQKWAESLGRGNAFRHAVFHAYFVGGKDIFALDELEAIAEAAGLPRADVQTILQQGRFADEVDGDWLRTRQLAITAVPFYLYGEEVLVGFRPYEDFVKLLGKT